MTQLSEAKLTSQGQVSIPKKVQEKLHLEKGARVVFLEDSHGRIYIEEAETPVHFTQEDWQKFLDKTRKEPLTRVSTKKEALSHLDKLMKK